MAGVSDPDSRYFDVIRTILESRWLPVAGFRRLSLSSSKTFFPSFTGTAAEVTPIRSLDDRQIGAGVRGPVTEALHKRYFEVVRGEAENYRHWLTSVD